MARATLAARSCRANGQSRWSGVIYKLVTFWFLAWRVVSFDEHTVLGGRADADEEATRWDCVHDAASGLHGLDELNAIATPAAREPGPFVTRRRSRTWMGPASSEKSRCAGGPACSRWKGPWAQEAVGWLL